MESEPGAPASTANSTGTLSTTTATTPSSSSSSSTTTNSASNSSVSTSCTSNATTVASATSASSSSSTTTTSSSNTSSSVNSSTTVGRQAMPQISVYSGIPDRQTVQVLQQFHRQPNTAAQYLQQMYAAQQQHLMLQTAALQQQHSLSTAQLQSLAAVQQASIAAGRQTSSQNGTSSQQTGSTQATINLTTSPAAAQLISRAQSISSTPTSISQQAVLLGSQSSPTLTASQAQMYLRAQMAQQSNLVQVARNLGRAVPLSPQLIFTPAATVTAVQSDSSAQASSQNQVQNLAIRGQQGATTSSSQTQTLQALSLKQNPVPIQPASLVKNPSQATQSSSGGKAGTSDGLPDGGKKGDSVAVTEVRAINMSRSVSAVSSQPLIAPAYTQIQPHSLVQQHKQQQFVVQQSQSSQRTAGQLLQTASIQPSQHPVPVLPKPAPHQPATPSQQATIFHSTISPHALHSSINHAKAQPVQLTAINLQIQPTAARLLQENKDKPTSLVVRETSQPPSTQQRQQQQQQQHPAPSSSQSSKMGDQIKVNQATPPVQPQGSDSAKRPSAVTAGSPPPAMTSGNESEAPTVMGSTPQNGESKPPQAIVKPQVLTHVIEGFVIQEGAEPFPVCVERLPILIDSPKKLDHQLSSDPDKTPVSNAANTDSEPEDINQPEKEEPKLTCEYCGWVDFAYRFKGSKRFCSVVCAKRYNVGCTKRVGLFRPERNKPTNRWRRRSQGRPSIEAKKQKLSPLQQNQMPILFPSPCCGFLAHIWQPAGLSHCAYVSEVSRTQGGKMATAFDRYNLHTTPEKFFIEACDEGEDAVLAIDRVSNEMTLTGKKDLPPTGVTRPIFGIMGTIRLVAGMYLIVITRKKKVGEILGHAVWKVVDFDVISYKKSVLHLSETQSQENKTFLAMINNILTTDGFYFCTDFDLTHTLQRLANTSPDFQEMSLLERADQRFVWNGNLLRELAGQPELHRFALPVVHGFIILKPCRINGKIFEWILISRRSCFRAGVRYYVRGIDSEGHAANFVETEQIVLYEGAKASFVQTRGSMPFYWSQRPNLKYKPKPIISKTSNHMDGFQRHFDSQLLIYGKQTVLNLVNQKGSEKPLEEAFAKMVAGMSSGLINYIAFDFHKECSHMRWDRLQILVDTVAETQEEYSYFMVNSDGKELTHQSGVFRSNCMDCLDRTNVIQSLLARRSLQSQLQRMGILNVGQRIEEQAEFEKTYKNAWADNANACAVQYAGTGALKTDFTRTGKRTKWGLLMDGWNSMIRYYKNNFSDGFRQDSIDLFLGNFSVDDSDGATPLRVQKDWKFLTLPIVMVVAFSMCIISLLMAGETWTETLAYVTFWGAASAITATIILFNGQDFVDAPKLVHKEKMD